MYISNLGVWNMCTLDRIMQLLKEQKKTQKQLCDYIGISKNIFTDWKSGRINSYTKYVPQIAEFLGVSSDYLLGIENEKQSIKEEDVKVALFGGDGEVTDEMWNEVKTFVAFVKEKNKKNNDND